MSILVIGVREVSTAHAAHKVTHTLWDAAGSEMPVSHGRTFRQEKPATLGGFLKLGKGYEPSRFSSLVPKVGLEPTLYFYKQILSLPRLPVPPFRHGGRHYAGFSGPGRGLVGVRCAGTSRRLPA